MWRSTHQARFLYRCFSNLNETGEVQKDLLCRSCLAIDTRPSRWSRPRYVTTVELANSGPSPVIAEGF